MSVLSDRLWLTMTEYGYLAVPALENGVRCRRKYFSGGDGSVILIRMTRKRSPNLLLTLALTLTVIQVQHAIIFVIIVNGVLARALPLILGNGLYP